MMRKLDLKNKRFGRLVVLYHLPGGRAKCFCDCGEATEVKNNALVRGSTKSCGCLRRSKMQGNIIKCKICDKHLPRDQFYKGHCRSKTADTRIRVCKECYKVQNRSKKKKRRQTYRLRVLRAYGGLHPQCDCCGEANIELLVIDHIHGGGNKQRKELGSSHAVYVWLCRNNYPEGYRVLCHGCNAAFALYKSCPHNETPTDPAEAVFELATRSIMRTRRLIYTKNFRDVIKMITTRRVWTSGLGKAGQVANKLASTLACNNIPAAFINASDALHGELGAIQKGDLLIAFSNSGKTEEIIQISYRIKSNNTKLVAITSKSDSELSKLADIALCYGKIDEACGLGLTPTTSTVIMLVLSDAIAMTVQRTLGIKHEDYARNHHAGYVGELARQGYLARAQEGQEGQND